MENIFSYIINIISKIIEYTFNDKEWSIISDHFEKPQELLNAHPGTSEKNMALYVIKMLELTAVSAIHIPNFEQYAFNGKEDHINFLNAAYCIKYLLHMYTINKEFKEGAYEEIKSISFKTFIATLENENIPEDIQEATSEHEFYNLLNDMNFEEASQIIEVINTDRKTKAELKNNLLRKKSFDFTETILSLYIKYDKAAYIAKEWSEIKRIQAFLSMQITSPNIDEFIHCVLSSCYTDNTTANFLLKMNNISASNNDLDTILNIDWKWAYSQIYKDDAITIYRHNYCCRAITNIKAFNLVANCISSSEYLRKLEKQILSGNINPFTYTKECRILEDFREKFLTGHIEPKGQNNDLKEEKAIKIQLPKNGNKRKKEKDYFNANRLDIEYGCKLYIELVKNGLLEANSRTKFAFIYRMCQDYKPELEQVLPIKWEGTEKELFNLIWTYHKDDTRKWEKTKKFFFLSNGEELTTRGKTNQAQSITKRMKSIFKSIE